MKYYCCRSDKEIKQPLEAFANYIFVNLPRPGRIKGLYKRLRCALVKRPPVLEGHKTGLVHSDCLLATDYIIWGVSKK